MVTVGECFVGYCSCCFLFSSILSFPFFFSRHELDRQPNQSISYWLISIWLKDRQLSQSTSYWLATIRLTGSSAQSINQLLVGHNMVYWTVSSINQSVIGWPQCG